MTSPPLISRKLHDSLAPLFTQTCQILQPATGAADQDAYGAAHSPAVRTRIPRPGCGAIPCAIGSEYNGSPRSSKVVRQREFTQEWNDFVILLNGYFPQITQNDVAVVGNTTYQVQGSITDLLQQFTHLHVRTLVE